MPNILIWTLLRPQYIIITEHIGILGKQKQTTSILGIIITNLVKAVVALLLNTVTGTSQKQVTTSVPMVEKLSKMLLENSKA